MTEPKIVPFDFDAMIECLNRHKVKYVIIGGIAAALHGGGRPTYDVDITPSRRADNLKRLALALKEMEAGVRLEKEPKPRPLPKNPARLDVLMHLQGFNTRTKFGDLDLVFLPNGIPHGYPELARRALTIEVHGQPFSVASLADVIRSKAACGRPKDLVVIPELLAIEGFMKGGLDL